MSTQTRPGTATGVSIPELSRIPGYGGFCPTVRKEYGKTYSNSTKTYYGLSRQQSLNTSTRLNPPSDTAASSPTVVNLSLVTNKSFPASCQFTSTVWSKPLPYSLTRTGQRRSQIINYNQSVQTYRDYYKDHSGLVQTVPNISRRRHSSAPVQRSPSYSLPSISAHQTGTSSSSQQTTPHLYPIKLYLRKASAKERNVRDTFFQKR